MNDKRIMESVDPFWRRQTDDGHITVPLSVLAERDALRAENAKLRAALDEAIGGRDAAVAEGLFEVLAERDEWTPGSLDDLVRRRLLVSIERAEALRRE